MRYAFMIIIIIAVATVPSRRHPSRVRSRTVKN